jgi:putative transposase
MDEGHLISAVRYVALNPVRARLAARAEDWKWSSVRAHIAREDDGLVSVRPVPDRATDFAALIADTDGDAEFAALRAAEQTGRPLGNADFIAGLECILNRAASARAKSQTAASRSDEAHLSQLWNVAAVTRFQFLDWLAGISTAGVHAIHWT